MREAEMFKEKENYSFPIKILYPISSLLPGGVQSYLVNLVTGLDRKRFKPVVAYGLEGAPVEVLKRAGIRVEKIPGLKKSISLPDDLRALLNLIKLIRRENPGIIHTNMSKANLLGRLAGTICRTPLVMMTAHGWANFLQNYYQSHLKRWIQITAEKLVAPMCDHYILVSYVDRDRLESLKILSQNRITVIPNGVDWERFQIPPDPDKLKGRLQLPLDSPLVVMVGNLFASKAPLDYLRAADDVLRNRGPVSFILVGDGKLRGPAENLIEKLNLHRHCQILGYRSDVPEILAGSDLFVLPTLREGLSVSILEAMAAGLPVVTTDIAENRELLEPGVNGWLVPPRRPAELAEKIISVLNNPVEAREMGERNRRLVKEKFTVKEMVEKTQNLYLNLWREKKLNYLQK